MFVNIERHLIDWFEAMGFEVKPVDGDTDWVMRGPNGECSVSALALAISDDLSERYIARDFMKE